MKKYHFIAIGGIGMSGLAKYLLENGHSVSGSDIEDSKYLEALRNLGANISVGHDEKNLPNDVDAVIVSTAIKDSNPELIKARKLGLKTYHRSDLLKEIADSTQANGKCFIGFAGTHGKTTTSGMTSYVLEKANLAPSFVVGGIVPELHTNAQFKNGNYFTAELDESDGTLVKYKPDILVINNLEEDHLDFYKNGMDDIKNVFNKAISQSKKVIINADDKGCELLSGEFITFGLTKGDYTAQNINISQSGTTFDLYKNEEKITEIKIELTGTHNIYNTLAVAVALIEANVNINDINTHFSTFTGMGRRFQHVCDLKNNIKVYDDYAHHPTEIKAVLDSASTKFGKENIVAVFQPHRYTRLKGLWNEFQTSFSDAERIIVTDVYEASETPIEGITGKNFANEINAEHFSGSIEQVAKNLLPTLEENNVVIGLGAGTITTLGKYLAKFEE
ncbi:UDP-N-acetylmuramate--L-alanine ligase [bacterium]|nr:UDP-N-acetylmuramate--L-alanine ligase [bacterium]